MPPSGSTDATGARPDRLRTHAIELYCRELCGSDHTAAATDNALRSISPADAWGGDDQLLRVTRSAAAAHVPPRAAPAGLRGMLAAEHQSECDPTPALLAQRANGELPPSLQFKLENHLARCLFCRAAEVREERASRAFGAVLATGLPASRRAPAPAQIDPGAEAVTDPPTAVIPAEPAPPPAPVAEPSPLPEPPPVREETLTSDAATTARRGMVVYPAARARAATPSQRGRTGAPGGLAAAVSAYRPFLLTLALGVVVIVVVALALGGGANGQSSAASLPPPSALSTPPPNVGIAVTRKAQKPHATPKPKPATATATTPTVATTTPAATSTPQASAAPPASSPAPAASAPAPAANNSPAASSPSQSNSGSGSGSSGSQPIVATQQGTGLPAQSAPTQGIGGGTPTTK